MPYAPRDCRSVVKQKGAETLALILGAAIQAFGIYNVHSVSHVTEGGIYGLELLLQHWFGISPAITSALLSTACYVLAWKIFGGSFLKKSAVAVISYSASYAVMERFPRIYPAIADMPLTAAVVGAILIGVGAGICVKAGGATAGDDALAMALSKKSGIKIENVYLIGDISVLLLSLSYIPLKRILYSLLTVFLSGRIIGLIQKTGSRSGR